MFDFSKKSVLGLDISDFSLKIIQLKGDKKGINFTGFIRKDIPAGVIQGGEIKKEEELITILKQALQEGRKNGLETRRVVCNLPEEKVFIRIIQLPKMKEEEVEQAIKWETEAQIPLTIDEVYLDWQIIEPLKNHLDHFDVLIAASPKTLIDGYLSVLKKTGLKPLALEPESMAMIRSLIKEDKPLAPAMVIDLGETGTNFVIFSASAIRFTSHIPILENNNDFVKQIQDYISFYREHNSHIHGTDGAIGQILLCGGKSLVGDLPSFLSKKLNLPVKLGNPWINIFITPPKNILGLSHKESIIYTTALGLALREFI